MRHTVKILAAILFAALVLNSASAPAAPPKSETRYTMWQMHQSTNPSPDAPNFWYKPWTTDAKATSEADCLKAIRKETGRRKVTALAWYNVKPDAPPDYAKWAGCWPKDFDPEAPPK